MSTITTVFRPDPAERHDIDHALVTEGVDAPMTLDTPYTINAGDTFNGRYDVLDDTDLVRVNLVAGQTYTFTLGSTAPGVDTFLYLRSSSGSILDSNDDFGALNRSQITYTAEYTGTYFLGVSQFETEEGSSGANTGAYSLTVSEAGAGPAARVATPQQMADQLTNGYWEDFRGYQGAPRSMDPGANNTIYVNMTGLNAAGAALAQQALDTWTLLTGIAFSTAPPPPGRSVQMTFDDEGSGLSAGASFQTSGTTITTSEIVITTGWLARFGTNIAGYSFQTYLHEIGHALGLGHAGNYNGSATFGVDNLFRNDSWQLSIMSYFDQADNTFINATRAGTITPMIADILAIEALYGPITTLRTSATTYGENSTAGGVYDRFSAINTDGNRSETVTMTILDNGGIDTLDFRGGTHDQRVDMRDGQVSDVYGHIGTISIAVGTVIENLLSGSGADTVTGNDAANLIETFAGNDLIEAGLGNDTIRAGTGNDQINGGFGFDTIFGDAGNDTLNGEGQADALHGGDGNDLVNGGQGFDVVSGNNGNDSLYGGAEEDWMFGGLDNDLLYGGDFRDFLYGGVGFDTLSGDEGSDMIYGEGQADALYGGNGNDQIHGGQGFDMVSGNNGNDTLFGGADEDWMFGGLDNDLLYGGDWTDFLFGGLGFDTIHGDSGNDTLNGEGQADLLFGGTGNDGLFGGQGVDLLNGGTGDDALFGGTENDTLLGGAGNDRLHGGAGADRFVFIAGGGDDIIEDFGVNTLGEVIDLSGITGITSFAQLQAGSAINMIGGNTVITLGDGQSITLIGVAANMLGADDFIFA